LSASGDEFWRDSIGPLWPLLTSALLQSAFFSSAHIVARSAAPGSIGAAPGLPMLKRLCISLLFSCIQRDANNEWPSSFSKLPFVLLCMLATPLTPFDRWYGENWNVVAVVALPVMSVGRVAKFVERREGIELSELAFGSMLLVSLEVTASSCPGNLKATLVRPFVPLWCLFPVSTMKLVLFEQVVASAFKALLIIAERAASSVGGMTVTVKIIQVASSLCSKSARHTRSALKKSPRSWPASLAQSAKASR